MTDPVAAITATPEVQAILAAMGPGDLGRRLGIELVAASAQQVIGRMPVAGNTQPQGLLHGGASAALAEQLASVAANIHGAPDRYAVGLDLSITHHRAVRGGMITCTATAVSLGRTVATYVMAITDDGGNRVASARLTCLLRDFR